ncbi:hypothetical protein BEI_2334 [Halomonas beimenensis]|uniref:Uncharacterized protein n=1 Tax=Halomonas beimenensis TaxID=475662 RepID=A0A291P8Y9_9GAMM|nr:hypothetical protein BEI_2334 [Halomonas beimenensis]
MVFNSDCQFVKVPMLPVGRDYWPPPVPQLSKGYAEGEF